MRAVMLSARPYWCEKIVVREKPLEVRKSRPKMQPPFKCYIYCTKVPKGWFWFDSPSIRRDGAVIGEFVCDSIRCFDVPYPAFQSEMDKQILAESCLTYYQLHRYAYHDALYGWHISSLVIYNNPKELRNFRKPCMYELCCESCGMYSEYANSCGNAALELTRPPQSWCYVEELEGGEGNG